MTSARRYQVVQRLVGRPATVIAAAVVLAFIVIALGAAHLAPFDPTTTDFAAVRKAPSAVHLLGTDEVGRDVLSRLIWGARASLLAGVIPVTLAVSLSIPLGLLSGYTGGWLDSWMMRLNDAILAIPFLIVAIALAAFLGPSLRNAMIAIGIASLPREVVQDYTASGTLRIVDCEWHPSDLRFTASYSSEPSNPIAERAAKLAGCTAHAYAARIGKAQPADELGVEPVASQPTDAIGR